MADMTLSVREKVRSKWDRAHRGYYSLMAALTVGAFQMTPTLCADPSMEDVAIKLLDIIFTIARWAGVVMVVVAGVSLIMAQKDENADGKSRAITFIIAGIALACMKSLVNPVVDLLT